MKVAVLGVGLIGGSIGLALKRRTTAHILGYDPDADALSRAVKLDAIDEACPDFRAAVADADLVFIATPVGATVQTVRLTLLAAGEQCIVTDVGSTKGPVAREISDPRFIGGHPLAGAETAGVEHARKDLFDGATWYLTPTHEASGLKLNVLSAAIESLGARPVSVDPFMHDELMAKISHLPHVIANVLVAQAVRALDGDTEAIPGGARSFSDATRVAGANTSIWADIYLSNRAALTGAIDEAIAELEQVRTMLEDGDAEEIAAWNERARAEREQLQRAGLAPGS